MTGPEVLLSVVVMMIISLFLCWAMVQPPGRPVAHKAVDAQNNRQVALAGIMYGDDYDGRIPLAINGRWSRLQNRHDYERTINCPGPGTQDLPSPDAAGAEPTRTWVELLMPYLRTRRILVSPNRKDPHGYFAGPALSATDAAYNMEGATYRNQGRFPFYGLNYMFLAPIRIPKARLAERNAINYAEGTAKKFAGASDPSGTIFFVSSIQAEEDPGRGFFVVNAPGMWTALAKNKQGYATFWDGKPGGGDWRRDVASCPQGGSCGPSSHWEGFAWTGYNLGTNATFLDGHVKYMKDIALAAGTNYLNATPGSDGSAARITNRRVYLWDYDGDFYGL